MATALLTTERPLAARGSRKRYVPHVIHPFIRAVEHAIMNVVVVQAKQLITMRGRLASTSLLCALSWQKVVSRIRGADEEAGGKLHNEVSPFFAHFNIRLQGFREGGSGEWREVRESFKMRGGASTAPFLLD